jgi:hypothetical protein
MKIAVVLSAALFAMRSIEALYCGNPAEPELIDNGFFLSPNSSIGLKAGYQGDFVFNQRLKATNGVHCVVDDFSSRMNQGVLRLNVFDRIEAFGSVGAVSAYTSFRPDRDGMRREFQTRDELTWGAGGQVLLFMWSNFDLGCSGSYQYSDLPIRWDAINGETFSTHAKMKYWQWQIAGLISYRAEMFIPYCGISYSVAEAVFRHVNADMLLGHRQFKMKTRDRVGCALGCSLTPSTVIDLNVEVRLFSEEALTIAGNVKF